MSFLTSKKLFLFGLLAVLLAVIPVTVFFLGSQTKIESKAERATIMCFALQSSSTCLNTSSPVQKNIGENLPFDIYLDPTGGTGVEKNKIVVATISINYDNTKLETDPSKGTGLGLVMTPISAAASQGFTQPLVDAAYTSGNASITLSVGTDALKAITQKTKIATITFKALAATDGTNIAFDETKSNATSTIDPDINVLSPSQPALIKIAQAAGVSPTLTPTPTAPAGSTPTPTPTVGAGTPVPNQIPVCTGLNVDRTTSGPSPFSITFTANGNDPNGTISKVTFDFGDGPVQDVTSGGGIGSKTISVAKEHTYNNAGTFTAKATLTDNNNGLSASVSSCTQTITVTQGTSAVTPTETPPTPLPQKTFTEQPGPGDTILGIGAAGAMLTIIGIILLFAL